jgi:uncharacterized phage-associated protein
MRLLKLLYIADREALREIGRTISGDNHAALKKGPILSEFYDIIKGETVLSSHFAKCFSSAGYQLILKKDAGNGHLNRYEIRKLRAISAEYMNVDDEDLSEITHAFPEWIKNRPPGDSSRPIPLTDIADAVGKGGSKQGIQERAALTHAVNELWR